MKLVKMSYNSFSVGFEILMGTLVYLIEQKQVKFNVII